MNVGLPYSNPRSPPADFDDSVSDVSDEFDDYIDSLHTDTVSQNLVEDGTQSSDALSSVSDEFDAYIDSLQTNAIARDSVVGASRVLRSSAVPAVHVSSFVPPDEPSSSGAPSVVLHGAPVSSASIRSSKSGKGRSKVKPLPKSTSRPKSSVKPKSSSVSWGSLTVRVDPSGTIKLHDLPLDLLTKESLRTLLIAHNVDKHSKRNKNDWIGFIRSHVCTTECCSLTYIVEHSCPEPAKEPEVPSDDAVKKAVADLIDRKLESSHFPPTVTKDIKSAVINGWLERFSNQNMRMVVCAVCSERLLSSQTDLMSLSDAELEVLQNPSLPPDFHPQGYDFNAFNKAILSSSGFGHDESGQQKLVVCKSCSSFLSKLELPPLALANDNFLGHDCVPQHIRDLFESATPVELSLVSRYRVRCTIHKYSSKLDPSSPAGAPSQRYMHGNTITFANECSSLLSVLPPPKEVLGETICVLFVGSVFPSPDDIKKMTPLLARRHVVWELLTWLKANHSGYKDVAISLSNLDALLPSEDPTIPDGVFVSHLPSSAREAESSGYTNENDEPVIGDKIPTPVSGVISQSIEGLTIRENKALAFKHWKAGGGAFSVPHAQSPVSEYDNPSLFPCMFPHIFPFGLGGFENKARRVPVSMQAHIKHLLNLDNTLPQTDNCFSFVAMNILQRRATSKSARFKVKSASYDRAVELLSSVEASACDSVIERSKASRGYVAPQNPEEKNLFELMDKVNVIASSVPGSSASKVKMRNEIRSLIHWLGSPTLFITLNPADLHSPIFCHFAGLKVDLDSCYPDLPSNFERQLLLSNNPAAAARFFHSIMRAFIDVVLDMKNPLGGLFGKVSGFYGTVEAQGRGSLHCHMVIWISDSPGPDELRSKLQSDDKFKTDLFSWLDDTIKTDVPGSKGAVSKDEAVFDKRPTGVRHPCTTRCPSPPITPDVPCTCPAAVTGDDRPCDCPLPSSFLDLEKEFNTEFQRQLYRIVLDSNWHFHRETCWKYLRPGDKKEDEHCRMRMDGSTRAQFELDPETGGILRRQSHPWINAYNDIVIMLLKGNMDISFIGSGAAAKALIYYITDYITKSALPTHVAFAALQVVIQKVKKAALDAQETGCAEASETVARQGQQLLSKACNALIGQQELSGQQVAMYLLGLGDGDGDHYTSHEFRTLYWAAFRGWLSREVKNQSESEPLTAEQVAVDLERMSDSAGEFDEQSSAEPISTPISECDNVDEDEVILDLSREGKISLPHSQLRDYLFRGDSLNDLSLYWYVATTERITSRSEERRLDTKKDGRGAKPSPRVQFQKDHPHWKSHLVRLRKSCVVPVLIGPTLASKGKDYERYCSDMLLLFRPWRTLDDLRHPGESWSQAFDRCTFDQASLRIIANMNHLHECKDAKDDYNTLRRNGVATHGLIDERLVQTSANDDTVSDDRLDDDESEVLNIIREYAPELLEAPTVKADSERTHTKAERRAVSAENAVKHATAMGLNVVQNNGDSIAIDDASRAQSSWEQDLTSLKKSMTDYKEALETKTNTPVTGDEPDGDGNNAVSFLVVEEAMPSVENSMVLHDDNPLLSDSGDADKLVNGVVDEFKLNPRQARALKIVAYHKISQSTEQLLMIVAGPGGTGKSRIIAAMTSLFEKLNCSEALRKAAPTGIAAYAIGGTTLHSLLGIVGKNSRWGAKALEKAQNRLAQVTDIVVDEFSMVGAEFLSQMSTRLGQVKVNDRPFGGINMTFFGDPRQLPPVGDRPLWRSVKLQSSATGTENTQCQDAADAGSLRGQKAAHGQNIWANIDEVVLLTENHRAALDAKYVETVERVAKGKGTQADRAAFLTRDISKAKFDKKEWIDAPLITADKVMRDRWNLEAAKSYASREKKELHMYSATDKMDSKNVEDPLRSALHDYPSSTKTHDRLGRLPLAIGMRVMIMHNILTTVGVVNGAEGVIKRIVYDDDSSGGRVALAVFVQVEGAIVDLPGLESGVVPVFPDSVAMKLPLSNQRTITVSRTQLPLLPAYSFTDYKSQARTLKHVVLDVASAGSLESAYVMVSRAVGLQNVLVLRSFEIEKIQRRQSPGVIAEMIRLQRLDVLSETRFAMQESTRAARLEHGAV